MAEDSGGGGEAAAIIASTVGGELLKWFLGDDESLEVANVQARELRRKMLIDLLTHEMQRQQYNRQVKAVVPEVQQSLRNIDMGPVAMEGTGVPTRFGAMSTPRTHVSGSGMGASMTSGGPDATPQQLSSLVPNREQYAQIRAAADARYGGITPENFTQDSVFPELERFALGEALLDPSERTDGSVPARPGVRY